MSKIISVNAGSSSLKFQLFEMDDETVITSGVIERIGLEDSIFTIKYNGEKDVTTLPIENHKVAVQLLLDTLIKKEIVKDLEETKKRIDCSISFDSLDNLVKGGRISKTVGVVTGILGIKIILDITDGIMVVKDKVRGSKKAVKRLLADVEAADLDKSLPAIIINVNMDEIVQPLKQYMTDNNIEYIESTVGSTVGIYSGDKAAGVFFAKNK